MANSNCNFNETKSDSTTQIQETLQFE